MYKTYFRNLAEKENGKFYFNEDTLVFLDGVRWPNLTFKVKFHYKDNQFIILNSTGTTYEAVITCVLSKTIQPIEFEINSISHFKNLFLRKKNRLFLKSQNQNIKYFIEKSEFFESLNRIADKDKFNPLVKCEFKTQWDITARYQLDFDDWTEPIEPLIGLYKEIIDQFENRIANMSFKSYREMN